MTHRERQLAAIQRAPADRVSVDAICVENVAEVAQYLGTSVGSALDRLGLDGRIVAAPYSGDTAGFVGGDEWGAPAAEDYSTIHSYPLAAASSAAEVERHPWPDAGSYAYAQAASATSACGDEYAFRGPYWKPVFCQACALFGMEEAMMRMSSEPAVFEAAIECVFRHVYAYCERLMDACGDGMPILCLGDDFATQRGLMISPSAWRRFLKPRYAQLFALGKRRGKFVWFHSCGDVSAVLPDLVDIGVDVWETVQLHTLPMSAADLKREYGRHLTFFGGVNTQRLPFASPAEVREEVLDLVRVLGEGGGYICGPDHHIKPDVSAEVTLALFDAATGRAGSIADHHSEAGS